MLWKQEHRWSTSVLSGLHTKPFLFFCFPPTQVATCNHWLLTFIRVLLSTHLSVKDSMSVKTNGVHWWFDLHLPCHKGNWVKSVVVSLVSTHKCICLMKTKGHWTMHWHSSVRTDHKILNNEAHNKWWQNSYGREFIGTCFTEIFTVGFLHLRAHD